MCHDYSYFGNFVRLFLGSLLCWRRGLLLSGGFHVWHRRRLGCNPGHHCWLQRGSGRLFRQMCRAFAPADTLAKFGRDKVMIKKLEMHLL